MTRGSVKIPHSSGSVILSSYLIDLLTAEIVRSSGQFDLHDHCWWCKKELYSLSVTCIFSDIHDLWHVTSCQELSTFGHSIVKFVMHINKVICPKALAILLRLKSHCYPDTLSCSWLQLTLKLEFLCHVLHKVGICAQN